MRGQIATEYIVITAIILLAVIPIFYYAITESSRTTRINQAADAVNTIARKAESVYSLGPGSRDYIWISVPTGIVGSTVDNGTVMLSFSSLGDAAAFTKVNITGTIPTTPGVYRIAIEMLENVVVVGPVNDTEPPKITGTSPQGTVSVTNPTIYITTNEPATCRYSSSDQDYNSMSSQLDGSGIGHSKQLSALSNGNNYTYYARCIDRYNNVMTSSAQINFAVNLDTSDPIVNNTQVDRVNITANNYICVNATVTDTGTIDSVWTLITSTLSPPLQKIINYTMSDTASCAGVADDNIYGVSIQVQSSGLWYVNTTFANDTAGNLGYQNPYPNILVNVSPSTGPGNAYEYKVPDIAWNFKTPNNLGIIAQDNQTTLTLATVDLSDEDKNTPPSSSRFYYTSVQSKYEGYIVQLNRSKNDFREYSLRVKTSSVQENPYKLTVYAYASNAQDIVTTNATDFNMTHIIISGVDRGYNEVNITQTIMAGTSPYIKIRVAPQTSMNGDSGYITEADIGVIV